MTEMNLTTEELLSTTRAVRKRLDFDRPVPRQVLLECMELALQAPTGGNAQGWSFVFVEDKDKRAFIGELYQQAFADYLVSSMSAGNMHQNDPATAEIQSRVVSSAQYLADNLQRAPVFMIPCIQGRTNVGEVAQNVTVQSSLFGSILPAVWSFMLAARSKGLGTCWTTLHLMHEKKIAELLGIPYDKFMQVALIPVAYTKGTQFKPGPRKPMDALLHFDQW